MDFNATRKQRRMTCGKPVGQRHSGKSLGDRAPIDAEQNSDGSNFSSSSHNPEHSSGSFRDRATYFDGVRTDEFYNPHDSTRIGGLLEQFSNGVSPEKPGKKGRTAKGDKRPRRAASQLQSTLEIFPRNPRVRDHRISQRGPTSLRGSNAAGPLDQAQQLQEKNRSVTTRDIPRLKNPAKGKSASLQRNFNTGRMLGPGGLRPNVKWGGGNMQSNRPRSRQVQLSEYRGENSDGSGQSPLNGHHDVVDIVGSEDETIETGVVEKAKKARYHCRSKESKDEQPSPGGSHPGCRDSLAKLGDWKYVGDGYDLDAAVASAAKDTYNEYDEKLPSEKVLHTTPPNLGLRKKYDSSDRNSSAGKTKVTSNIQGFLRKREKDDIQSSSSDESPKKMNATQKRLKQQGYGRTSKRSKGVSASNFHRRSPPVRLRSQARSSNGRDEVIAIDDSSDEESGQLSVSDVETHASYEKEEYNIRPRRKRAFADRATIDAVRIAVGKKVFRSQCEFSVQLGTKNPYIMFSFHDSGASVSHYSYLKDNEITEMKYFIARDDESGDDTLADTKEGAGSDKKKEDPMTIIAFRITPSENNGLRKYTNAYANDMEDVSLEKRYVSAELRSNDDFQAMLLQMREIELLQPFLASGAEICRENLPNYASALREDSRKDQLMRLGDVSSVKRPKTRSSRARKNEAENNLLLVYPFEVDEKILTEASIGLCELNSDSLGLGEDFSASNDPSSRKEDVKDHAGGRKGSARTHYVTIRDEDKERLEPGEFLNDTLVDFWMRWISRREQPNSNRGVHFFTSHFVTTLIDEGVEAVSSWTAKKNLDIFEKKLIFLPVNRSLHWSLCVVVNPGCIRLQLLDEHDPADLEKEWPCILFLDSLNMHKKNMVAKNVRNWLNNEWKRLNKGPNDPFNKTTMKLLDPKIPYQDNSWDCGVFACRYAYSVYLLRHRKFTRRDVVDKFKSLVTRNSPFQFNMEDISRIREEFKILVETLSIRYSEYLEKERTLKKESKRRIQNAKDRGDNEPTISYEKVSGVDRPKYVDPEKENTANEITLPRGGIGNSEEEHRELDVIGSDEVSV